MNTSPPAVFARALAAYFDPSLPVVLGITVAGVLLLLIFLSDAFLYAQEPIEEYMFSEPVRRDPFEDHPMHCKCYHHR